MLVKVIVSLLVFIFVLKNTQLIETKLLFVTTTVPRAFLLSLTFLFGFVVGSASTVSFSQKVYKPWSVLLKGFIIEKIKNKRAQ